MSIALTPLTSSLPGNVGSTYRVISCKLHSFLAYGLTRPPRLHVAIGSSPGNSFTRLFDMRVPPTIRPVLLPGTGSVPPTSTLLVTTMLIKVMGSIYREPDAPGDCDDFDAG